MGISAGPNYTDMDGREFHLEAKEGLVAVWGARELSLIFSLRPDMARQLAADLTLHAYLVDGKNE